MAGSWTKLTAVTDTAHLDTVSAIMSMLSNGLMIEDYSDFSLDGMYGALVDDAILNADPNEAKVSLFVPEEKNLAEYRAFLDERFAAEKIPVRIELSGMAEEDFAEAWKKYYSPIPLGRITVVPAWMDYEEAPGEVVIRMDPGMAFGTGTHETTRLVLRLMQDEDLSGRRMLDVGCGSGILSIAAAKLGAKECFAYDIDPVAVRVAKDNAESGGFENIHVGVSDLLAGVDRTGGKFDFCTANIVADVILRMLPDMRSVLKDGAPLILSGVIEKRAEDIRTAAKACGYRIEKELTENDWIAFLLR